MYKCRTDIPYHLSREMQTNSQGYFTFTIFSLYTYILAVSAHKCCTEY